MNTKAKNKKVLLRSKNKKVIPIFFATDDNYVHYLSVALQSIIDNSSQHNVYKIYVLETGLSEKNINMIRTFKRLNILITFVDITKQLEIFQNKFYLRDYYSKAIYYRILIPSLFPQYDKALYLDCDIVVLDDIANLYNQNLNSKLLGVITEEVMVNVDTFGKYSEDALDILRNNYFNSGVLLMNLKALRNEHIEEQFVNLLNNYKFLVAPDQDYLNVLCKDRVLYLHKGWNRTPIVDKTFNDKDLKLIHYKMNWKPWHYDGVLYGEYFWKYAQKTCSLNVLLNEKENHNDDAKERDSEAYKNLVNIALQYINDDNNYKKLQLKK